MNIAWGVTLIKVVNFWNSLTTKVHSLIQSISLNICFNLQQNNPVIKNNCYFFLWCQQHAWNTYYKQCRISPPIPHYVKTFVFKIQTFGIYINKFKKSYFWFKFVILQRKKLWLNLPPDIFLTLNLSRVVLDKSLTNKHTIMWFLLFCQIYILLILFIVY